MEIRDKVVIVTGGASGIGRALARRFAADGARGVVIADLDGAGAERVAAEVVAATPDPAAPTPGGDGADRAAGPPLALGVRCDVMSEEDVAAAIVAAEQTYGPVDLYCANAGVGVGIDEQEPDEVWELALGVNLRAHVLAARMLIPGWLERGSGHLLVTASAAGLLTQIGSAPYAVSKHAAVAFAEWLSVTYGDRGIGVSCLCPMGVDTPLLATRDEAGAEPLATTVVRAAGEVLDADAVAQTVVAGLRDGRFLILPHPEVLEYFRQKGVDYDRWLTGMRRLQEHASGIN